MNVLSVVAGVSTFLGAVALIAYLYFQLVIKRATISVRNIIEDENLFNAEQIIKILSQFKSDRDRLSALQTLTKYGADKTTALLTTVKKNVDINELNKISSKHYRILTLAAGVFFLVLAVILFYNSRSPRPVDQTTHISAQFYLSRPTGRFCTNPKNNMQIPITDQRETLRVSADVLIGGTYWIPPLDQSIPAEQACPDGQSVGKACSVNEKGLLSAYARNSCDEPRYVGPAVPRGCSRVYVGLGPLMIQCCFYDDGPVAHGFPFGHPFTDWFNIELAAHPPPVSELPPLSCTETNK